MPQTAENRTLKKNLLVLKNIYLNSSKEIFIWIVAKKYFFETNNCLFDIKKVYYLNLKNNYLFQKNISLLLFK